LTGALLLLYITQSFFYATKGNLTELMGCTEGVCISMRLRWKKWDFYSNL